MLYDTVGCGGTFDHLHAGHRAFLRFVFSHGKKVIIGLTTDAYVKKNKGLFVSAFAIRKQQLEQFLETEGLRYAAVIVPIDTVYGPAIDPQETLDALVVTEETAIGALEINKKRKAYGLSELPVLVMPLVKKNEQKISSSGIRAGEIDQEGDPFIEGGIASELLLLPESLRKTLKEPFGKLYSDPREALLGVDPSETVVVGDATTVLFHKLGVYPKLVIIDFSVGRKKTYDSLVEEGFLGKEQQFFVQNPPATITPDLWHTIKKAIHRENKESAVVIVAGEEDLAVLPLLTLLPLHFVVYYGQPNEGVVKISVDLAIKKRVKSLLRQFKRA